MKVLHVIPSLWQGDGGPAHAVAAMERALSAQGVAVETASTDDAGPGRRNRKAGTQPVRENGVPRHYFAKVLDFYKCSPAFGRWIDAHVADYDLVHVHALFSFTSTAACRAARRHRVPYVMRPLGTLEPWGLLQRRPALKRLSLRWVEAPLLRDAAAVHFTSESEQRHAMALGIAMRGVVIPLGVDVAAAGAREPSGDDVRILYLSRLDAKKNVEGLLEAFALLRPEFPRLRLAIAGDGDAPYTRALRQRSQALGIDAEVEWLGHVEGDAKQQAFARADCFALPSHSENFGIAAAEALAQGLPCVLGRGVAIADEVQAHGAGVAVGTAPAEIAQGLRLIIPAAARSAMSGQALRLARERFSTEAMGARLHQLYTDILSLRHGLPAKH